ncbi:MAG: DEAD/DEAH box helicase [Desulfobulbaceae bacterium]|jgi:uncharacterized Zn finger protein/superfamily II DNA or RNA helicase|nr:DEAD/DEAH box helicase [Desulfobulbaceae bacterium]
MAEKFGKTWWGENWLRSLENVDYDNRLPRGATYARGGRVKEITIEVNSINAKVKGTRTTPYTVKIVVPPFTTEQRRRLIDKLVALPAIISKLLNRELDPQILAIAEDLGLKVFPRQWTDFKMNCSCPDWAVPCKHLAAVIYVLSREIDNDPFLVFTLHQIDLLTELNQRGLVADDHAATEILFFPNLLAPEPKRQTPWEASAVYKRLDFSRLENIGAPLLQLLTAAPPFYPSGDFRGKYAHCLTRANKGARRILAGRLDLAKACDAPATGLGKRSRLSLTINASNQLRIGGEGHKLTKFPSLLAALSGLTPEYLVDYHPTVAACHRILFAALHLLANSAVVPHIVLLADEKFMIRWAAATMDEAVRTLVEKLAVLMPPDLLSAKKTLSDDEPLFFPANPGELLLSRFLGAILDLLLEPDDDLFIDLFFHGGRHFLRGVGEKAMPGAIKVWLDRFHLGVDKRKLTLVISEEADERFALDVSVENPSDPDVPLTPLAKILKEKQYEKDRLKILQSVSLLSPFIQGLDRYINAGAKEPLRFSAEEFAPFFLDALPAARLLAINIVLPQALRGLVKPKAAPRLKKKSDGGAFLHFWDIFDFDWQVALGDQLVSEEDFLQLMRKASRLFKFRERYFYLDDGDLERLRQALAGEKPLSPERLLQVALSGEYEGTPVALTEEALKLAHELTAQEEVALPDGLRATLRPYQVRGFSWMYRNSRIGFGSILADDMGLGKTVQVLALLQKFKEEKTIDEKHRALVVAPTGLLANWQAEITRFAPTLSAHIFHGTNRDLTEFTADVLLTTYGLLRADAPILKKMKWRLMVIDEAQNIKNHDAAQTKAVKSIPADIRIAMSGTPVENRLSEFWSIMDYANRGYLGTAKGFKEEYATPIQVAGDADVVEKFKKITAPFIMRRMKSDKSIIADLPEKIEQNQYARLTKQQAALYEKTVSAAMREIENVDDEGDSHSMFKRQGLILQMILALKQICNHPTQFLKNDDFNPALSGKIELLFDLLDSIAESGEKALIFTQFREMGDLLERFIDERFGEKPLFYHGGLGVKKREELVDAFQNGHADRFFILSLKAAGTGLNLTAASQVIHYDLWWNPAVENQATDRAYRLGQKKNVMAHRLICQDTFEERIDEMIQKKKHLADLTVATGENWLGKLSDTELREIFA